MTDSACTLLCREDSLLDLGEEAMDLGSSQTVFKTGSPVFRESIAMPEPVELLVTHQELDAELQRLRSREVDFMPKLSMGGWVITSQDRAGVIHLIYKIVDACQMRFQTQMLAVNIFDRYIASLTGSCRDLPVLLAIACVQLAAKMEENDFQPYYIAHILRCFSRSLDFRILAQMEGTVLKVLDWRMSGPTVAPLLETLVHMITPQLHSLNGVSVDDFAAFVQQVCAIAMQDAYFATLRPSCMALAVIKIALVELGLRPQTLHKFLQPIETNFSGPELNCVFSIQKYLSIKMQTTSQQRSKKTTRDQRCCHEPALAEGSPLKKPRAERLSPTSVLHVDASPSSDVDPASPLSCLESADSLLPDDDSCL